MGAHGWRATLPAARTFLAGASGRSGAVWDSKIWERERSQTGQCVKVVIHGSTALSIPAVVCSACENVPSKVLFL